MKGTDFSIRLPLVLLLVSLVPPLLSDDLRDVWIGKARIPSYNSSLMILAIEDKSCFLSVQTLDCCRCKHDSPFLGLGTLGSGWQRQKVGVESLELSPVWEGLFSG